MISDLSPWTRLHHLELGFAESALGSTEKSGTAESCNEKLETEEGFG